MNREYKDKEKLNKRLEIFESSIPTEDKLNLLKNYSLEKELNLLDLVFESKNIAKIELTKDSLKINDLIDLKSPNFYEVGDSIKTNPVDLLAMINMISIEEASEMYNKIESRQNNLNNKLFDLDKNEVMNILKEGPQYSLKSEDILKDFNIIIDDEMYQNRKIEIDSLEKVLDRDIKEQDRLSRESLDVLKDKSLTDDFPIEKYGGPEL
ncbi:hypothetical protein [Peptoniphilus timonensis]|uniref:hypothetical protein n=1 Tax=Peptoniphilus timonensis TaxID=1268254 RepID=UPI0002D2FE94|nr:hypothetical protein [Peptoniphilus timonensis]